jgi:hypothetical protein
VKQILFMAQALRLYPQSCSSFTDTLLRRSHGADDQSNLHLVAALMIADAKPSKRTRHLAKLRGGPLLAWVNLHDGDGNDIFNQFDFTQIASKAGEHTSGLIINRSSAESSQKVLLQSSLNPALSNHLVATLIAGTSIAKEVIHLRSVQWDVRFVQLLGYEIQAALDTDASLLQTRVSDAATLNEVALVCRSPRSQRLVASHALCSVETALLLPAGSALEAFHDPGTLYKRISDKVGGAADAVSTLSVEFNGSLSELINVAKGLIQD